jgi:signal transduction histidine kinase
VDDVVPDALTRIRGASKHTNQIVDDMLTVARQQAGHLRLNRKTMDLRTIP